MVGYISLFTLHIIWPFLWIWAYLFTGDSKIRVALDFSETGAKNLKEHIEMEATKINETNEELEEKGCSYGYALDLTYIALCYLVFSV